MNERARHGFALLLGVALVYAAAFAGLRWVGGSRLVTLDAGGREYLHYELVELRLTTRDAALDADFRRSPPRVAVARGMQLVTTISGLRELTLSRQGPGVWTARWPVPWNAPEGEYSPVLLERDELRPRLRASSFRIARRVPRPLPKGYVVATFESITPLETMKVRAPDGSMKDWRGLVDWVQELGADALWVLGGQTPGLKDGEVWKQAHLQGLPALAAECRRRGLGFGVYAMYSLTMSDANKVPGYQYAEEIKDGKPVPTRAISIRDPRRLDDVVAFLKPYAQNPDVDFLGIDYIRNALGGYELVDDFVAEMPGLELPPEWKKLSREERMTWLARKKIMRKDRAFVDAWQWWRARRVALIVRELKARLGAAKPLWAFTLTWEKGWHHGQDPVMMNDAGVDVDALMFYEADKEQYAQMLKDWGSYVRRGDVQLMPGNVIDWPLHQRDPAGPGEFGRRLRAAVDQVYADGPASALFIHDLSRLLWGRRGPWSVKDWAAESRRQGEYVKSLPEPSRGRAAPAVRAGADGAVRAVGARPMAVP